MTVTSEYFIYSLFIFIAVISISKRKYIPLISVLFLLGFLGFTSPFSALVFISTSFFTFFFYKIKWESVLIPAILILVLIFLLFKIQFLFGTENPLLAWGYPIGLSYFLVRQIHFLFEAYKDNLEEVKLSEFLSYAGFFPAFFTGPIHRLPEFLRDLKQGSFNSENLSAGLERILYGYVKVVVLANYLVMDFFEFRLNAIELTHPGLFEYLDCVRYGSNLYFQFAGYTDIAIGVSLIAGFRLRENFNFPFLATNINDFWKRWHISLSDWCKDYVFKPVFAKTRLFGLSILLTMLAIGVWHEFSGRYVLWALYHGLGITLWQLFEKNKRFRFQENQKFLKAAATLGSVFVTLNFVILSFCITKEDSVSAGIDAFKKMLGLL